MIIEINGIEISVNKKAIKNMHIRVKPPEGNVVVSAPHKLSDENIKMFLLEKIDWIMLQKERFQHQPNHAEQQFVSGETIYVWGRRYVLQVNYSNKRSSVSFDAEKVNLNIREENTVEQRCKYLNEWYRGILKTEIERLLPKWEQITGLYCDSFQIKNMITRWGTCNVNTKKVWINLQLAKKTPDCLEYIILHELAHLKERNHGKKFKDILDKYMPNWREIKKKLNG